MLRPINVLIAVLLPLLARPIAAQDVERLFYYVDRQSSWESLVAHIDQIDIVGPQVYTVDSLGIVWGSLDPHVKQLAAEHDVKVMPLVVNEGFNQPALRRLLADTAARSRAIRSFVRLCRDEGYWGIQFDIENVNIEDRDRFTSWYRDAADALHGAGCTISLAVVHRLSDEAGPTDLHRFLQDSWRAAHDLEALAEIGDFVSFMTYDQHTRRTPPGPISGLSWMREAIDYALQYVPASKLSAGIPTYGRHWRTESAPPPDRVRAGMRGINWAWGSHLVERHGATMQWDEVDQVPFAHFANGGVWEWVFLENARSFEAKLGLVREKGLRGFSAWVLGGEDENIWPMLQRAAPSGDDADSSQREDAVTDRVSGTFDVKMIPDTAGDSADIARFGRYTLDKRFHGPLEATSRGSMMSVGTTVDGSAGYVAIEQVTGLLDGRHGSFVLQHSGVMSRGDGQLTVTIVPDSGTDELGGIAGSMTIRIADGKHFYDLDYTLGGR